MLELQMGINAAARRTRTIEKIKKLCMAGEERIFVLVPEQCTFSMQREICEQVGNTLSNGRVDVVGFKQFVSRVYGACGHKTPHLDDGGRLIAMAMAIENKRKSLRIFGESARRPEFIATLLSSYTMMELYGAGEEKLAEAAEATDDSVLSNKLSDLSDIFGEYSRLCQESGMDSAKDIETITGILASNDWLRGTIWFIEDFSDFPKRMC